MSMFLIVKAVAGLGANVGAVNFIARLRSLGQQAKIPVIVRAAVIPVAVVSVAAAAGLFLGSGWLGNLALSGHLGHSGATPATVADALRALALVLPFAALLDTILGAGRGYRDMRPTVVVDNLGRSVGQLLGVLAAVAVGSAALLAPLWAAPYVPASILAWLWLRRIRRRAESSPAAAARRAAADAVPSREFAEDRPLAGHGVAAEAGRTGAEVTRTGGGKTLTMTTGGFWRFTAPRGSRGGRPDHHPAIGHRARGGPARSGRGRGVHRRDAVSRRRAVREYRYQHGRAAAVRRTVRGGRPERERAWSTRSRPPG